MEGNYGDQVSFGIWFVNGLVCKRMESFQPADPKFESRVSAAFRQQPMMQTIGAEIIRIVPGEVEIVMPFDRSLTQQDGFIHAGVITSILDSACGFAAYSLMDAASRVLSVEYKVNLLRPAAGERFVAVGRVIKPGRRLTVCTGEATARHGGEQKLVAIMQATITAVTDGE
jgi:uncharacterized protein (TIGR00369 family)